VEAAADVAEEQNELLARRTADSLDQSLSKAQEAVRQQASDDRESMNGVWVRLDGHSGSIATATSSGTSSGTSSFLAKRGEDKGATAPSPTGSTAAYALAAGTCALVLAYATFRSFRRHRSVEQPQYSSWMVRDRLDVVQVRDSSAASEPILG